MYTPWRYSRAVSSRSPWRFFGRSLWREQDPYDVKVTLLLARYEKGRAGYPSKVHYLSNGQESSTTTGFIYYITCPYSAMGQCEYGFHFGSTSDPKGAKIQFLWW